MKKVEEIDLIALAGLLHDIGKFGQRAEIPIDMQSYDKNLYCPFFNGHHSHLHAIYTADFLKSVVSKQTDNRKPIPALIDGESFENISARHHRVYDHGTAKEWIVAMADRIASGFERDKFDKYNETPDPGNFKEIRLESIFDKNKRYKLDVFDYAHLNSVEKYQGDAKEYSELYDKFLKDLQLLLEKPKSNFQNGIEFLLKKYTTYIPSSTYKTKANIPLFDHLKTTAVFSSALYAYHKDDMDIEKIRDYDDKKFLLIAGDFFGIQNFIFSDLPTKHAAKILRGKSAYIQIFTKVIARHICEVLELSHFSIISDSAGKFEILAANNEKTKNKLKEVQQEIDDWFLKETFGESGIGISSVVASPEEFTSGKFQTLRESLSKQVEAKKYQKFDLTQVDPVFNIETKDNPHLCKKCGKRFLQKKDDESCQFCDRFIKLGEKLAKADALQITTKPAGIKILGNYFVKFDGFIDSNTVVAYDIQNDREFRGLSKWELKSYVKFSEFEDRIEEFSELAEESCGGGEAGVKALMALKGDVDNMGNFLKTKNINSFAIYNFLSRLIDYFFSVKVSKMMEGRNVYTVFAGGDDLFIIGAWDEVIELAKEIREEFMTFCESKVSSLSISMGLIMTKPNKPINFVADISEKALEEAKDYKKEQKPKEKEKNAITLFGETVGWQDYKDMLEDFKTIQKMAQDYPNEFNTAFWYRLLELCDMRENLKSKNVDIKNALWRSKVAYMFKRNIIDKHKNENFDDVIKKIENNIETYGAAFKMVVSEEIYKRREA